MKKTVKFTWIMLLGVAALSAQGPPPGGPGPDHGFGLGPGFGPGFGGPETTIVTAAPYSGVETFESVQTLANGNQIKRDNQKKVYRDSKGRVRTESTTTPPTGGQAQTRITIFDPIGDYIATLNPQTLTAVKRTLPTASTATTTHTPPIGATAPQVQTTDLGTKVINNLTATGTRTTITIPAGAIGNTQAIQSVREVWISTDLKVPVLVTSTDPRSGTSTQQLTNVVRAEPDANLFVIPANYTVTTATAPTEPGGQHP